jgi:trimethylamine--corrinoid protein Co-methyltransferase
MNGFEATSGLGSLDDIDEDGLSAIHEASMRIVERIGVKLNHERARTLLEDRGAEVDEDRVTIPRSVVEDSVAEAPAEFTLHARNPDNDVVVGGDGPPVRAPAYGPPNVRTYEDGRRPSTLSDYEDLVKLAQLEDVITCTGYNVCEPNDVDESVKHLEMLERSLVLTDQPVMGSTYGAERAQACLDMAGIAVGDRDLSRPYVAGLINTVPPRSIDAKMLGGLLTYAEHGQPPIVSSFTMAGASGPATLAGSMAQANAETLVGITLAQLVNPGTPVVYGVPSSNIDFRYGSLSIGSPESALFVSLAARMGEFYDLPSRGGGALSDSKSVDYQSGFESMLLQTIADIGGIDYVLHAAGVLESYSAISPEKFVLDCEGLRYLDCFREGYDIDDESFQLETMTDIQPAGHFLGERQTLVHSKEEFFRSKVADKRSHDDWVDSGSKSALERSHERVQRLLDRYERPPLDGDVEASLNAYLERHRTN